MKNLIQINDETMKGAVLKKFVQEERKITLCVSDGYGVIAFLNNRPLGGYISAGNHEYREKGHIFYAFPNQKLIEIKRTTNPVHFVDDDTGVETDLVFRFVLKVRVGDAQKLRNQIPEDVITSEMLDSRIKETITPALTEKAAYVVNMEDDDSMNPFMGFTAKKKYNYKKSAMMVSDLSKRDEYENKIAVVLGLYGLDIETIEAFPPFFNEEFLKAYNAKKDAAEKEKQFAEELEKVKKIKDLSESVNQGKPKQQAGPAVKQEPERIVVCPNCSAALTPGLQYCPHCGKKLRNSPTKRK